MNSKYFFLSTLIAVASLVTLSCEKKAEYTAPQIGELSITPNPCSPGDTVVVHLPYISSGNNWYFDTQSFSMPDTIKKNVFYDSRTMLGRDGSYSEPKCSFIAPDTIGSFEIKFTGQITKTASEPGESIWGAKIEREAECKIVEKN